MPKCASYRPDGASCERIVGASQTYCYAHDPARAEARRRNASKAARSKPSRELVELKAQLGELADAVLAGELDKGAAAVVNQLLNTKVRVIALERDVRAQEDFEARIAELEGQARERWEAS